MRHVLRVATAGVLLGLLLAAWGWRNASAMPEVRRVRVALAEWPINTPSMTVAVISDIHIGNRAMDAHRLSRIVDQVNALRPDLILIAGDFFIAGHKEGSSVALAPALTRPLARLNARVGKFAVIGNHDHWTGAAAVRLALERAGVAILDNEAERWGALTVVGIGDRHTGHDDIATAMAAARALPGPRIIISHGPDIVPDLPMDAPLVVVGHTHCGQIIVPLWGPLAVPSRYGRRYLCGIVRERGRATIVSAGLGASIIPIRYGAPPDIWMLTVGRVRS